MHDVEDQGIFALMKSSDPWSKIYVNKEDTIREAQAVDVRHGASIPLRTYSSEGEEPTVRKALTIAEPSVIILGLQDEIRRSAESRYDHRLHGVLLVAEGMNCCRVAELLGDAPRTVEYWVRRFEAKGLAGLQEGARRDGLPG